jgi:hypothetical protein
MTSPRPIGFWLKLVDRLIDEQFAVTLEEHGVTRRQWQLLNVLASGPATVEQLDAAVAPVLRSDDHESSVEHLTELIDSAWVDATPTGYELTERGLGAFERLQEVVATQRTLATEGVTTEQYEQTLGVLEVMARNLGWDGP